MVEVFDKSAKTVPGERAIKTRLPDFTTGAMTSCQHGRKRAPYLSNTPSAEFVLCEDFCNAIFRGRAGIVWFKRRRLDIVTPPPIFYLVFAKFFGRFRLLSLEERRNAFRSDANPGKRESTSVISSSTIQSVRIARFRNGSECDIKMKSSFEQPSAFVGFPGSLLGTSPHPSSRKTVFLVQMLSRCRIKTNLYMFKPPFLFFTHTARIHGIKASGLVWPP